MIRVSGLRACDRRGDGVDFLEVEPGEVRRHVEGTTLQYALDAFHELGVDRERLTNLLCAALAHEPGPPTVEAVAPVWQRLYREHVPPFLGILAGARVPFGVYETVDYLASSCESLSRGIECLARYFSLIYRDAVFAVVGTGFELRLPDNLPDEFFEEYTSGIVVARFRQVLRRPLVPMEVRLRRAPPGREMQARLTEFFGVRPEFDALHARILFAPDDWTAPLIRANKRLELRLQQVADEMLAEQDSGPFVAQVRTGIVDALREGDARVTTVAERMATTARTLQRRLKDEGASYQDILEQVRRDLAQRYLEDRRLSVTEIAFLLGYSEASAFARAFRRWLGCSPQVYRERAAV